MGLVDRTIGELFQGAVHKYGELTALKDGDCSLTWAELDRISDELACRFRDLGIKRGDHAGIWGENSAGWIASFIALQKIGAVAALFNSNYRKRELIRDMEIGDVHYLIHGTTPAIAENPSLIDEIRKKCHENLRACADVSNQALCIKEMLKSSDLRRYESADVISSQDTACMLYTTGTTADPKCAMHRHYSVVNNAIVTAERAGIKETDRICLSQPLFHVFALCATLLASFYCGSCLCVLSRFGSEDILRCIDTNGCTVLNGVPTNFLLLVSNPVFGQYKTESLRLSVIGGGSITAAQLSYLRKALPTTHFLRDYGLTEGTNLCNSFLTDREALVNRTVGAPYPYIELEIQDPVTGKRSETGKRGEIIVRGYSVMQGYFDARPGKQPASPVDDEGWLHTGDLGVRDKEGYISIAGRIKDIIIRGGENIAPVEVSTEILRYEPVMDAVVVGASNPLLGEEVVACLVLDTPEDYSEGELRSMLKVRLSRHKIPSLFLLYDRFPVRKNGKIDMRKLKKDVQSKAEKYHSGEARYHAVPGASPSFRRRKDSLPDT